MATIERKVGDDLRDVARAVVEATTGVTTVVEEMHCAIASGPSVLGSPLSVPARLVTGTVYGTIRAVTRLVGGTVDVVLRELTPVLGESTPSLQRDAIIAAVNGVLGDRLAETKHPLATEMVVRGDGAGARVVVLVHGSSMHGGQWRWRDHDHGAALARDAGFSPVYVHYNSGLPLAENGRQLAERLDRLADAEEIAIVGHSMGGLVARIACHVAETKELRWRTRLRSLVTLGTPHLGAPLESFGSLLQELLGWSRYSAPVARLAKIRSAGILDLGRALDIPLPQGVDCHAIAAARDRLVPTRSAHGPFPAACCSIVDGASHTDLLSSPVAYETILRALRRHGR